MSRIIITGCNGNLALSVIEYLSINKRHKIIGCDLHENFDPLKRIKVVDVEYFKTDLMSIKSIDELVSSLKFRNLIPDIIINNAAIDSVPKTQTNEDGLNLEYFDNFFLVNVRAPIYLFKLISSVWLEDSISGKVVNLSTIYSKISPDPNIYSKGFIKNILYGSSKAALNNAFKQISVIYADKNIQINSLLLAGVESTNQDLTFKKKYINRIPIKRFLNINEIYKALELLIDNKNSYMTGSEIVIDGAYSNI